MYRGIFTSIAIVTLLFWAIDTNCIRSIVLVSNTVHYPVKISAIIVSTADKGDFLCLGTSLYYLSRNTVLPDEVIIVMSNLTNGESLKRLHDLIDQWKEKLPNLRFFPRKEAYSSSENKNYAAMQSRYQYMSFLNVEDEISKFKIEFSKKAFKEDRTMDMMIHEMEYERRNLLESKIKELFRVSNYRIPIDYNDMRNEYTRKVLENKIEIKNTHCCDLLDIDEAKFHNSLITMKKKVWEELKYIDMNNYEDAYFNTRSIIGGYNVGIFKAKLVFYNEDAYRNGKCHRI